MYSRAVVFIPSLMDVIIHRSAAPVLGIDVRNQFVDLLVQLGAVVERLERDLNQNNLAPPFGVDVEEHFKGLQFLDHTAHQIESVSANDDFAVAVELFERLHFRLDAFRERVLFKLGHINAQRQRHNFHVGRVDVHSVRRHLVAKEPGTTADKVSGKRVVLEPNLVGSQHAVQQQLALAQALEVFRRRERNMKKMAYIGLWKLHSQNLRQQQQEVVVDPDDISWPVDGLDFGGIGLVEFHVVVPPLGLLAAVAGSRLHQYISSKNAAALGPDADLGSILKTAHVVAAARAARCGGGRVDGTGSCNRGLSVVRHVRLDQMAGRKGRTERELGRQDGRCNDLGQLSCIGSWFGWMRTLHPQELQHGSLRLQNSTSSNGSYLDRWHRDGNL
ncbi:hypothetical protein OGATHE_003053 [Ogataea polymorpha]|uniref:Uncharacterized protein n=1 Tax=Ogataea polymorpha TaxID=460523 RepID=A0A9P8PET4_9ASCO|nr:hypothetical protein OGATHE_003053 [Ogataea polymorpha]